MASDKSSWLKHFHVSRGEPNLTPDLEPTPLLSKTKSRDPSNSPSRFRFPGTQSIDIVKKGSAKPAEPFSFDVWSNTPPKDAIPPPDVEHMAQAMMSRLNSAPGDGLPASYNSHVFRVIRSHHESVQKIDALKRKLEESALLNEHLRMQLDMFHPERKRAYSGASKASWDFLRERLEQSDKDMSPEDSSSLGKQPASSPEIGGYHSGSVSKPQAIGRKVPSAITTPSIFSTSAEHIESTPLLLEAKSDGAANSSTNTTSQSGDILSTMYRLAGLMVGKRDVSFHYAFYRIFRAFYDDAANDENESNNASQKTNSFDEKTTEDIPPLSDLLEEANRLESGDVTPR